MAVDWENIKRFFLYTNWTYFLTDKAKDKLFENNPSWKLKIDSYYSDTQSSFNTFMRFENNKTNLGWKFIVGSRVGQNYQGPDTILVTTRIIMAYFEGNLNYTLSCDDYLNNSENVIIEPKISMPIANYSIKYIIFDKYYNHFVYKEINDIHLLIKELNNFFKNSVQKYCLKWDLIFSYDEKEKGLVIDLYYKDYDNINYKWILRWEE